MIKNEVKYYIMTSETTTTTTTTPDVVDELVKYYLENPQDYSLIKPLGSFVESPYFYSGITKCIRSTYSGDGYVLHISSNTIINTKACGDTINLFTFKLCIDYKKAIVDAVKLLRNLQFCKVSGEFVFKNSVNKRNKYNRDVILNKLWNMEQDLNCCVCKEGTSTETICGHRLCLICWSNINGIAEKEHKKPKCPICRGNIKYANEDYCETDSD